MANGVVHWEISSKDYKKAQEFYGKLFDWKIEEPPEMPYGMVEAAGEGTIGGGIGPVQDGQAPALTFYVMVDDLQAYLDRAESLGGKTLVPPSPIPGIGSFAIFADPDGLAIGLFKRG